jgi:hypothetical protein
MNIPFLDFGTLKYYEKEVGLAAEKAAKESRMDATALEQTESIGKLLLLTAFLFDTLLISSLLY